MENSKQIFQSSSPVREKIFIWITRSLGFCLVLMIPMTIISFATHLTPLLPDISSSIDSSRRIANPIMPKGFTSREERKYKGFSAFMLAKDKLREQLKVKPKVTVNRIRAAFYVDWDPQSFYSLQKNVGKLNMVLPEWFFIDPSADTLKCVIDQAAFKLMKEHRIKIIPIINNFNIQKGREEFDGQMLHRILHNSAKRERLINDIVKYCHKYQLQGINVDFEEFNESNDEPIITFQKKLWKAMKHEGLLVTQDIMPENADFNVKELAKYNDYMFLMAYDQHYTSSAPGPVSAQRWIEKILDETSASIPSEKIILSIAGYGYDWPQDAEAATLTYQQAMAEARERKADIKFDNDTYNDHYSYADVNGHERQVYFTDAITNFNTIRFADEYGAAGTALWRLGSEDERLWTFYNRDLTNESLQKEPFNYQNLSVTHTQVDKPDYIGDGEILNVISQPQPGKMDLEIDSAENIIAEQKYIQLPTGYVIKKYGVVKNQVILTFDDGPDPDYTPAILDILKKEKIHAAFFIIGMNAEENLPLLKRIYREGHEIGNHTFTHPNMAEVSPERALAEMETTRLLIESAIGRSTTLFRAPYNADAEPTKEVELKPVALSRNNNYYTVGESIDPNDWDKSTTADSIYNRVVQQYEANPEKGIILLHDAGGDRSATVTALPRIIHYFKKRGVAFTTVANLLHTSTDKIMPPARNSMEGFDSGLATSWFWFSNLMTGAFWVAIFLGLVRILLMGILAVKQYFRSGKEPILMMPAIHQPPVSIIVPAYNEEINAVKTISNLLEQNYPALEIIFVDDGSKDKTYQSVYEAFNRDTRVKILTKANGGKASALNFGISQSERAYVVCIDADTQLQYNAVTELMKYMVADENTGAVAGNVKVGNEKNILTRWQSIEYTTAQNFDRRAFDLINGICVVPGAIGAFRKEAIYNAGGFTTDTLAEDCDLTIRILRAGYIIRNCATAIAITEAPETIKQFMKQRFRWSYGIMQSFWKNRDACFNPKYKALGMVALPNILVFQILLPLIAPLADIMLLFSLAWNWDNSGSLIKIVSFYGLFLAVDMIVSLIAFSFEKEKKGKLLWIIPQRFMYRQIMYVILFRAIKNAIKGGAQGWGSLKRTGNVKQLKTMIINPAAPTKAW